MPQNNCCMHCMTRPATTKRQITLFGNTWVFWLCAICNQLSIKELLGLDA